MPPIAPPITHVREYFDHFLHTKRTRDVVHPLLVLDNVAGILLGESPLNVQHRLVHRGLARKRLLSHAVQNLRVEDPELR